MGAVDELLARARELADDIQPVTKQVDLAGEMVGVRFVPLSGKAWRDLTSRYLPREGSFFDQNRGYNIDAVLENFPGISIVRGEDVDNLRRDTPEGRKYIWSEVYALLDAPALELLTQALWEVHEYEPQMRMIKAGKALRAASRKKPDSPANSASPSANSTGGRRSR